MGIFRNLPMLATSGVVMMAAGLLGATGAAFAQSGQNGCYFGECPGGRPAQPVNVAPPPAPAPSVVPKVTPRKAQGPISSNSAPKTSGPKVGGNFCPVLAKVTDLVTEEFKSITGGRIDKDTEKVTLALPGADLCFRLTSDGNKGYVCAWTMGGADLTAALAQFTSTVSNCFDGANVDEVAATDRQISATEDADILVSALPDSKQMLLVVKEAQAGD